jgi:hypothetical protein
LARQERRAHRLPFVVLAGLLTCVLSAAGVSAAPFTLTVQPIQVCQDDGAGCANAARQLYEPETDKIWAQAGIDIQFRPWVSYHQTDYLTVDSLGELSNLFNDAGHGATMEASVVSMWFVNTLLPDQGTVFGAATVGGNRVAIADPVFATGRRDTIAHELGHTFGLDHYEENADAGYSIVLNLMSSGVLRAIPGGVDDIYPSGAGLDQLSPGQVAWALGSTNLDAEVVPTPEPSTLLLLSAGLLSLVMAVRRRRRLS